MSYKIKLPVNKKCVWYHNSLNHYLNNWGDDTSIDSYEKMFNVRIFPNKDGAITIVFPSESDASMFLLRWS